MLSNLNIVFPELSYDEKKKLGRESFRRLFYQFYEFCLFSSIDDNWIREKVQFKGLENLNQAFAQNKGVMILSLHLGHGDMGISMLANKGYPLFVISKFFKIKWLNDFWFGTRQRFGAQFLDPHGRNSSFDILKILKNKGAVIFVLDQYMGPPFGLETTFFGIKTGTAYGLSLFSIKTNAPVVPVWTYRNDHGQHIIEVGPEIKPTLGETREESLLFTTQKYNFILENLIRTYPKDWLWIHRRWKKYYSDL